MEMCLVKAQVYKLHNSKIQRTSILKRNIAFRRGGNGGEGSIGEKYSEK